MATTDNFPPNHHKPWTDAHNKEMYRCYTSGWPLEGIANHCGRTVRAILIQLANNGTPVVDCNFATGNHPLHPLVTRLKESNSLRNDLLKYYARGDQPRAERRIRSKLRSDGIHDTYIEKKVIFQLLDWAREEANLICAVTSASPANQTNAERAVCSVKISGLPLHSAPADLLAAYEAGYAGEKGFVVAGRKTSEQITTAIKCRRPYGDMNWLRSTPDLDLSGADWDTDTLNQILNSITPGTLHPPKEDLPMSSIETRTFINGEDADGMTDSHIFGIIKKTEDAINRLNAIQNQPDKLKKQIEELHKFVDDVKVYVDGRPAQ